MFLVLVSHRIPFQTPAVVIEEVYIPPALVALFHKANVLVKALTLLFNQISTVLWKIVKVWPQKVLLLWHSYSELVETLKYLFIFLFGGFPGNLLLLTSLTVWQRAQLCSMLRQTLDPSWVLLFEGRQICQPWVSPCLSMGTFPGEKQTRCLPCPM